MCLRPVKIYNQSRKLGYGKQFRIEVPCGKCAECKKMMKNEYTFRAYYNVKETIDAGGFIYFDTLTYDNDNLPHVSEFIEGVSKEDDFSCFRTSDYRLFFVRLRRYVTEFIKKKYGKKAAKNVARNLKYFLSSEYGTSEKGTHRPHYHILLFITFEIDPYDLSELVSKAWNLGRTDGIPFQSKQYVKKHVFGKISNMDEKHIMAVCNYVAKYVGKDSEFEREVDNRIKQLCISKFGEDYEYDYDVKSYIRRLKGCMTQFHRQSQGFGLYGLVLNNPSDVLKTGMMSMPDSHHIVKHMPLCSYLQRKIFYDLVTDDNGHKYWRLNEVGVKYKAKRKLVARELLAQKMEDWQKNLREYLPHSGAGYDIGHTIKVLNQDDIDKMYNFYSCNIERLLAGRSWLDFADYMLFYKGRIITPDTDIKNGNIPDIESMVIYDLADNHDVGLYYNYSTVNDKRTFGCKFVSLDFREEYQPMKVVDQYERVYYDKVEKKYKKYKCDRVVQAQPFSYGNDIDGYHGNFVENYKKAHKYDVKKFVENEDFERSYCFDENSHKLFKDFDKLYQLYCRCMKYMNEIKQDTYDYKEIMQKRLKSMGFYVRSI